MTTVPNRLTGTLSPRYTQRPNRTQNILDEAHRERHRSDLIKRDQFLRR